MSDSSCRSGSDHPVIQCRQDREGSAPWSSGHLLGGAALDAGGKGGGRVGGEFGGVGDVVSAGVDGEVEVVGLSASAHGGVDRFSRHGLVDEDQGVVAGGALGFVDGHGVAVGEVTGFGVCERHLHGRVVGGADVELAVVAGRWRRRCLGCR